MKILNINIGNQHDNNELLGETDVWALALIMYMVIYIINGIRINIFECVRLPGFCFSGN